MSGDRLRRLGCRSTGAVLLAALLCAGVAGAEAVVLDEGLLERGSLTLGSWRFQAGDDSAWAAPAFDDSDWPDVAPDLRASGTPEDWEGEGWFRQWLDVSPGLAEVPLALDLLLHGVTEVYLDGELLARYGETVDGGKEPRRQPHALHLTLEPGRHLLAVRYANPEWQRFHAIGWRAGFTARLGESTAVAAAETNASRSARGWAALFSGVYLSFAVLHSLLFVFWPRFRENLFFGLVCSCAAALAFLLFYKYEVADPRFVLFSEPAMNVCGIWFGLFAVRFVYGVFYDPLPRRWRWMAILGVALALWGWFDVAGSQQAVFLTMLASSLEVIRVVVLAMLQRRPGSAVLGAGVISFGAGFTIGVLALLGTLPTTRFLTTLVPFFSLIGLLLSMSIYLALDFARTQRELRERLEEVERLSEEKLEQERRARKEEVARELLAAELEEARQLQLSMLPRALPEHPGLEIAARMETATEVGGDYYDFLESKDGALTFAVGDATGHGLRAGTMVTAAKSLFLALAGDGDLGSRLDRANVVLKQMRLKRLAMALTLGRYEEGRLELASAGMPPIYCYRAAAGEVETIELPAMPLGAMLGATSATGGVELAPGDTLFFASDGFAERLDDSDEMLGYERAETIFFGLGGRSADEVVDRLWAECEQWAGGRALDDDVTLVVLRRV